MESQDKAGNFIGYLFCENQNLSVHLVAEGYASMHFTADRSNYCNQVRYNTRKTGSQVFKLWSHITGISSSDPKRARQCEVFQEEDLEGLRAGGCRRGGGGAAEEGNGQRAQGWIFLRVEVLSTVFGMSYLNALVDFSSLKRPGCSDRGVCERSD